MLEENEDINFMWKKFKTKIKETEKRYVPTSNIKLAMRKKRGFPIDKETLNKVWLNNTLLRKAIRTKDPEV